jgi:glutamate racemase
MGTQQGADAPDNQAPIGIVDPGVGGPTVLRGARDQLWAGSVGAA